MSVFHVFCNAWKRREFSWHLYWPEWNHNAFKAGKWETTTEVNLTLRLQSILIETVMSFNLFVARQFPRTFAAFPYIVFQFLRTISCDTLTNLTMVE